MSIWIRSTNSEKWGHLFSIQHDKQGRDLWVVEYEDGETAVLPSWGDPADYAVCIQNEPPEDSHGNQGIEAGSAGGPAGPRLPDYSLLSWSRAAGEPAR